MGQLGEFYRASLRVDELLARALTWVEPGFQSVRSIAGPLSELQYVIAGWRQAPVRNRQHGCDQRGPVGVVYAYDIAIAEGLVQFDGVSP